MHEQCLERYLSADLLVLLQIWKCHIFGVGPTSKDLMSAVNTITEIFERCQEK